MAGEGPAAVKGMCPTMKRLRVWFQQEWAGITGRFAGLSSEKKTVAGCVLLVMVAVMVAAGVVVVRWAAAPGGQVDTTAYRAMLIDPAGGDLPAPDFVGWTAEMRDVPPQLVQVDEQIMDPSPPECVPGGDLNQRAHNILVHEFTRWSGETLNLVAYNARFDVDIANPKQADMSAIDAWTGGCPRTRFVKDGVEHVQKIQTLPIPADRWGMDDSRVWTVTLTRLRDGVNLGTTSTLYALSRTGDVTLQGALTIRGSVDDNALETLNVLWSKQTTKVHMQLNTDAGGDGGN